MKRLLGFGVAIAAAVNLAAVNAVEQVPLRQAKRPNIIVILTDDQDLHMDSLNYMPLLKKHVVDQGTSYKRHYCTTAICCPSRVSLWTGRNAHNTNVTDVIPPYGSFRTFCVRCETNVEQVDIPNSFPRDSMRITSQYGFRMRDTAPTIPANSSMPTPSTIGTHLIQPAGPPQTFCSILTLTSI